MKFIKFEETNDHEGETWYFWLQVDHNEEELEKLNRLLSDYQGEDYWLYQDWLLEDKVDVLVEHGGWGYMNYHNKVTGKFKCPDYETESDGLELNEFLDDKFYKGRIEDHFTKEM